MKPISLVALLLAVACIALGIWAYSTRQTFQDTHKHDSARIVDLSNSLNQVTVKLEEQQLVNQNLETDRDRLKSALGEASNSIAVTSAKLEKTIIDAKSQADAAAAELAKRDAKINELQGQNDDLNRKIGDLTNEMSGLELKIADTQRKLTASTGDRDLLLRELKRLQTEKANLQRQFNDLVALRVQLRKIKDELAVAKKFQWIRDGVYGALADRGAERLIRGAPTRTATTSTGPSLNIDLRQNGEVKIESVPASTNAPVQK
jgi:chromosome segregation ATPase